MKKRKYIFGLTASVIMLTVIITAVWATVDHGEKCARECMRTKSANFCIGKINIWSDTLTKLDTPEDIQKFLSIFQEICPLQKKTFLEEFPDFKEFDN